MHTLYLSVHVCCSVWRQALCLERSKKIFIQVFPMKLERKWFTKPTRITASTFLCDDITWWWHVQQIIAPESIRFHEKIRVRPGIYRLFHDKLVSKSQMRKNFQQMDGDYRWQTWQSLTLKQVIISVSWGNPQSPIKVEKSLAYEIWSLNSDQ